jgi:hypothetical protein
LRSKTGGQKIPAGGIFDEFALNGVQVEPGYVVFTPAKPR